MLLREPDLHPRLWKACDEVETRMYLGKQNEEFSRAMGRHTGIWSRLYGKNFLIGFALWFASFLAGVGIAERLGLHGGWVGLAILGAGLVHLCLYMARNRRTCYAEELANLLPVLDLTEAEQAYARTVVAVAQSPNLSNDERSRLLQKLKESMEGLMALGELRARLADGTSPQAALAECDQRIAELEAKIRRTEDAETVSVLQRSLDLAQRRREAIAGLAPLADRVEAHYDYLIHSMTALRESLGRLEMDRAMPALDVDSLVQSSQEALREAQSLEQALAELRRA
jgi:hypothetical protein